MSVSKATRDRLSRELRAALLPFAADSDLFKRVPWEVRNSVERLLERGADPNAVSFKDGRTLLDGMIAVPELSKILIEHGAKLSQAGLEATCDKTPVMRERHFSRGDEAYWSAQNWDRLMAHARAQPELDWYVENDKGECLAFRMEHEAVGLNDDLEEAQKSHGLPVGRVIEDRDTRVKAILNMPSDYNEFIWVGSKNKVDMVAALMQGDIDPNHVYDTGIALSDGKPYVRSILSHLFGIENGIAAYLMERGARVSKADMTFFVDSLSNPATKVMTKDLFPAIFLRFDDWKDFIHDHLPHHTARPMIDMIAELAPEEYAAWQASQIADKTATAHAKPRKTRI